MARPKTLSEEEKKQKRKDIESKTIKFRPPLEIKSKFDKFVEINGNDKTKMLIKMMNAYPPFKSFSV